ncbi:MAG: hypothetical protein PHR43_02925 [Dehalococcoidales bacterium]|nr:hypothetical protein [Dehalococcoidales bacterium]
MLKLAGETELGVLEAHENSLSPHVAESLPLLFKKGNLLHVPVNGGWTASHAGSGTGTQNPADQYLATGTSASSRGMMYCFLFGFDGGAAVGFGRLNWDKRLYLIFNYCRYQAESETVARFQLKEASAEGALAAKGIGIRSDNLSMVGESYGTEPGAVDLATVLTHDQAVQVVIVHYPASKIEWYVNGVLKGTQATAARIPSGNAGATSALVHSVINGATGGVSAQSHIMHPRIWQER